MDPFLSFGHDESLEVACNEITLGVLKPKVDSQLQVCACRSIEPISLTKRSKGKTISITHAELSGEFSSVFSLSPLLPND